MPDFDNWLKGVILFLWGWIVVSNPNAPTLQDANKPKGVQREEMRVLYFNIEKCNFSIFCLSINAPFSHFIIWWCNSGEARNIASLKWYY